VKRVRPLIVISLALAFVLAPMAWAAATNASAQADRSPGAPLAHALSTVTGLAISPLLGTGALGAYQWLTAKDEAARAKLPWYAQPDFWVPALLLVAICAAKDGFGAAMPPGLKKPFDVLEVLENKVSGLMAAGAVVPFAMDTFSRLLLESKAAATAPPTLHAGFATISPAMINWAPALDVLAVPLGIAVFAVVWMASHAINVLILLSPWGAIDAALKAARTALLGLITLTAAMNPWLGALLSVAVIVIAYFVAGWAFRLTVFGTIFSWEFVTRRRTRFVPASNDNAMFTAAKIGRAPARVFGRLVRRGDELVFVYRPWLVFAPQTVPVSSNRAAFSVGRGWLWSVLATNDRGAIFVLPPRYRGHEEELVRAYGFAGEVRPAGMRRAWISLRQLAAGDPAPPPVLPIAGST
jgi:hypothetical protein